MRKWRKRRRRRRNRREGLRQKRWKRRSVVMHVEWLVLTMVGRKRLTEGKWEEGMGNVKRGCAEGQGWCGVVRW